MLQINKEQFEMLGEMSKSHFLRKAKVYLKKAYPNIFQRISENDVDDLLEFNIRLAESNGLCHEKTIIVMTELSMVYGVDYIVEQEWASYIIEYYNLTEEEIEKRLRAYL